MKMTKKVNLDSVLALVLILLVVVACTRSKRTASSNTAESGSTQSSSSDEMTADALFDEYQKDKEAADRKYKGKLLTITGTVDSVKVGVSGNPYVTMKTSNLILRVQFLFKKKDESALSRLRKGDQATIRGRLSGRIGNVLLEDCEVL
jgi:hypothetical protein